jgi:PKD repeat protein
MRVPRRRVEVLEETLAKVRTFLAAVATMRLRHVVFAMVPALACGGGEDGGNPAAPSLPPTAAFTVAPGGRAIVDVTALSFAATGADPHLAYTWDFGDGTSASGVQVAKTYRTTGTFRAQLTVSDGRNSVSADKAIDVGRLNGYWSERGALGNYGIDIDQQGGTLSGQIVTWRHGCNGASIRGTISGRSVTYSGEDNCGHVDRFEGTLDDTLTTITGHLRFTETDGITRGYDLELKRQ